MNILEKLKSRGYWLVTMRPSTFKQERISLGEAKTLVQESIVKLRGWYYPHIDQGGPVSRINYIESSVDWNSYIELWRLYQSGQFAHLFAAREDWLPEERTLMGDPHYQNVEPKTGLEAIRTLYRLTEIYYFAKRMAEKGLFDSSLVLQIALQQMKGRRLFAFDPRRSFDRDYVCHEEVLSRKIPLSAQDLMSNWADLALDHSIWIFERFNWHTNVMRGILWEEQRKLLSGKTLVPLETSVEPSDPSLQNYVDALDRRDVVSLLSYYHNSKDALVEWKGQAGAYAGTYHGYGNIRILFATFIGNTGSAVTKITTSQKRPETNDMIITAELERTGVSRLAGSFKMVIGIDQTWRKFGNSWRIIRDSWNFKRVDAELIAAGGF